MIPLNKPGFKKTKPGECFFKSHYSGINTRFLSNAGDGLHVIFSDLYKQKGSLRVGVCPLACTLALEPIIRNGHTPVFIDVNPDTFNLDSSLLESRVHDVDALEVIHLGGNPNEMDVITDWAKRHHKIIIEDCAQALGSSFDGIDLGLFGDYASFSLMKNVYAPVGGLLVSKQVLDVEALPEVSSLLVIYREIKKYLESHVNQARMNPWNWVYSAFLRVKENNASSKGTQHSVVNAKMEERLIKMFDSVSEYNRKRQERASFMIDRINPERFFIQKEPLKGKTNRNRLLMRVKDVGASEIIHYLRHKNIAANNLTQNYLKSFQPHVSLDMNLGRYYCSSDMKNYDDVFPSLLAIPCSPFLKEEEMVYIVKSLNAFFA